MLLALALVACGDGPSKTLAEIEATVVARIEEKQAEDAALEATAQAMAQLGMAATVLHSTSWRHVGQEVVLTYIAVVPPESVPPPSWTMAEVGRSELARGDATAPPSGIDIGQVLEHALRHLAWLRQDDPVIAELLGDWSDALADYVPEPFRALGGPPI
jgi:hypothetical protein